MSLPSRRRAWRVSASTLFLGFVLVSMSSSPGHTLNALLSCAGSEGCTTAEDCGGGEAACCDGTCTTLHTDQHCSSCDDDCTKNQSCLFHDHCAQQAQNVSCDGQPAQPVTYWACTF